MVPYEFFARLVSFADNAKNADMLTAQTGRIQSFTRWTANLDNYGIDACAVYACSAMNTSSILLAGTAFQPDPHLYALFLHMIRDRF